MQEQTKKSLNELAQYRELTLRGIILGALITVIFTASNVYLGLKVGMTFASSIPAAVISMAVLRFFKDSNILENNMVQTQSSSAGCLSAIIFVLPGMLMLGYWHGFPFWQTFAVCSAGGILGVIFTIPLRHVMIVDCDLPYPEGVAAAEILKTADKHMHKADTAATADASRDVKLLVAGSGIAGIFALLLNGFRVVGGSVALTFKAGTAIFHLPLGFSFALLGAGYLVGISGGIAILTGTVFTWAGAVPLLSSLSEIPQDADYVDFAMNIWVSKVRFIGVGCIAIAAVWTLLSLMKQIIKGIKMTFSAMNSKTATTAERIFQDLSPKTMLLITICMAIIIAAVFWTFVQDSPLSAGIGWLFVFMSTLLALLIGFLVAAACGYMAGIIGSSSSPISGISILSIIIISVVFLGLGRNLGLFDVENGGKFLTALALFTVSVIVSIAAISNDNLQDLKTGYLVEATPWRQEVALIIGCIVGAMVIAPVLELLYEAYGFTGAMPREGMDPAMTLGAPQATLITAISQSIFSNNIEWTYFVIGLTLGAFIIFIDILLKNMSKGRMSIPALAVGFGIYLPATICTPLFIGALLSWFSHRYIKRKNRDNDQALKQSLHAGTLLSSGFIIGESIIGVVLATVICISISNGGSESPLALDISSMNLPVSLIGLFLFICGIYYLYRQTTRTR